MVPTTLNSSKPGLIVDSLWMIERLFLGVTLGSLIGLVEIAPLL